MPRPMSAASSASSISSSDSASMFTATPPSSNGTPPRQRSDGLKSNASEAFLPLAAGESEGLSSPLPTKKAAQFASPATSRGIEALVALSTSVPAAPVQPSQGAPNPSRPSPAAPLNAAEVAGGAAAGGSAGTTGIDTHIRPPTPPLRSEESAASSQGSDGRCSSPAARPRQALARSHTFSPGTVQQRAASSTASPEDVGIPRALFPKETPVKPPQPPAHLARSSSFPLTSKDAAAANAGECSAAVPWPLSSSASQSRCSRKWKQKGKVTGFIITKISSNFLGWRKSFGFGDRKALPPSLSLPFRSALVCLMYSAN